MNLNLKNSAKPKHQYITYVHEINNCQANLILFLNQFTICSSTKCYIECKQEYLEVYQSPSEFDCRFDEEHLTLISTQYVIQ